MKLYAVLLLFFFVELSAQSPLEQKCNQLISRSIEATHSRNFTESLQLLEQAKSISKNKNWNQIDFLISNNYGHTYLKMMQYENAIYYFLDAYEKAKKHKSTPNEITALNNIAVVYIKINELSKAEFYFKKAFETAKQNKINSKIAIYATNLAQLNFDNNKFEQAQEYISIALQNFEKNDRSRFNVLLLQNAILIKNKDYQSAINNLENLQYQYDENQYIDEIIQLKLHLSDAYLGIKNYKKAFELLETAEKENQDIEVKKGIYESKNQYYITTRQLEKALIIKDSLIKINNKISALKNESLIENKTLKFELSEKELEIENQKLKAANLYKTYLFTIITIVLFLTTIIVVYYKKNTLSNQKKLIAENQIRIKDLEIENEIHQRKILEKEIDEKNIELNNKILFQTTRNELIEIIIEHLSTNADFAKNANLKSNIQDLKRHLKEDSKWDSYIKNFDADNLVFNQKIIEKHPNLTSNDIRFISYIRLNLTMDEISNLLNISSASCRKRKERLIAKLNISKEINLQQYFKSIS